MFTIFTYRCRCVATGESVMREVRSDEPLVVGGSTVFVRTKEDFHRVLNHWNALGAEFWAFTDETAY